jgi:hypothetical protein
MRDISEDAELNVKEFDGEIQRMVRRIERSLRSRSPVSPTDELISYLLDQQLRTHKSIRLLTKTLDESDSLVGDALSLVREQIERVFIVSLLLQDKAKWTEAYLRGQWFKDYKLFLIEAKETSELERFEGYNTVFGPAYFESQRKILGLSEQSREWVQFLVDKPGATVPKELETHAISRFPAPPTILKKTPSGPTQEGLRRWYVEYERACDFTHSLAAKIFLGQASSAPIFDINVKYKVSRHFGSLGIFLSYTSTAYICAEVYNDLPMDVELLVPLDDVWQKLINSCLLAGSLWKCRTKHLLPALLWNQ